MANSLEHDTYEETAAIRSVRIGAAIGELAGECHRRLRQELPRLDDLLDELVHDHGDVDARLLEVRSSFENLRDELLTQVRFEEGALFPLALQMMGSVVRPSLPNGRIESLVQDADDGYETLGAGLDEVERRMKGVATATIETVQWFEFRSGFADMALNTRRSIFVARQRVLPELLWLDAELDD